MHTDRRSLLQKVMRDKALEVLDANLAVPPKAAV
jgi:hypothetical protein